tara:strand:+ start:114 stop:317 length:204 start_codon:yes stop_codon:yes gene_type:complete
MTKMNIGFDVDFDSGEASLSKIPKKLDNETPLFKADVLRDMIDALTEAYEEAIDDMNFEIETMRLDS